MAVRKWLVDGVVGFVVEFVDVLVGRGDADLQCWWAVLLCCVGAL